jgi:polysaccharide biosynthesis/export protein
VRKILMALVFTLVIAQFDWAAAQNAPAPSPKPSSSGVDVESTYIIGPGDVLEISVWKDEALTKSVIVLPDGTISYPLLGLLKASGKTVAQLKAEIEKKISQYVPDPTLHVEVKQIGSMTVYVIGRVNAPGRFSLNTSINVLQALASAGGLNPFAKRDKIKVFRQEGGTTKTFTFRYDDVADGKHLEDNIELKRGDVIVVP